MTDHNTDKIITLADLQKDFERERRNKGEIVIKPKNGGETYALKDKSYKSSPDFFRQLFRKVKEEKEEKGED
ncbi:MAG: hypothetical protein IJH05_03125 [Firmicutes bacterium]|nr:hypothetical protein [Bacillota bacterium]